MPTESAEHVDVSDDEFISELHLWIYKCGKYPLELITFFDAKNGQKLIAIPTYGNSEKHLFLGEKSYGNYQSALTKVGALMDKMDIKAAMESHIESHPLTYAQ